MTDQTTEASKRHEDWGAVGSPVQRPVGRLAPERAGLGDTIICGVRNPYPHTIAMKLETPASVAYANKLLARKAGGWRLVEIRKDQL